MAEFDLVIRNGTIVTASDTYRADIGIRDGMIVALAEKLGPASEEIDASDRLVLPGGVDSHCHIDECMGPAYTADTFETATRSAAAGGTTTVISFTGQPEAGTVAESIAGSHAKAKSSALVDYSFHVIMHDTSDEGLAALEQAIADGHRSLKIFMTYGNLALGDAEILRVLTLARRAGALVTVHAENNAAIVHLTAALEQAGLTAMRYHAQAKPIAVEREACHRMITLAEIADVPVQIFHVSGEESAAEVRRAQARGVKIFAETCPQYLFLTEDDLDRPGFEGAKYLCSPAPRTHADQEALWKHLRLGTLGVISSDHAATRFDDPQGKKRAGENASFAQVPNGVPGLAARLPLLFSEGVNKGRIDLNTFVALTATNPAKLFGLSPRKGTIAIGADADLVLWDRERKVTLTNALMQHAVDYTPYEGMELTGWPVMTLSRGQIVAAEGEIRGMAGHGRFLPRGPYDYILPARYPGAT